MSFNLDTSSTSHYVNGTEIVLYMNNNFPEFVDNDPSGDRYSQDNITTERDNGDFVAFDEITVKSASSPTIVTAGSFSSGTTYVIVTVGTTDFTDSSLGATANEVGLEFTPTGAGSGTGTAIAKTDFDTTNSLTTNAADMVDGNTYKIVSVGTTDFTSFGATENTVGHEFTANGAGTGDGVVVDPYGGYTLYLNEFKIYVSNSITIGDYLSVEYSYNGSNGLKDESNNQLQAFTKYFLPVPFKIDGGTFENNGSDAKITVNLNDSLDNSLDDSTRDTANDTTIIGKFTFNQDGTPLSNPDSFNYSSGSVTIDFNFSSLNFASDDNVTISYASGETNLLIHNNGTLGLSDITDSSASFNGFGINSAEFSSESNIITIQVSNNFNSSLEGTNQTDSDIIGGEGSFTFQQDGSEILAETFDISGGEISFSFSNLSTSEITIVYDGSGDDLKDENDNQLEDTSISASDTYGGGGGGGGSFSINSAEFSSEFNIITIQVSNNFNSSLEGTNQTDSSIIGDGAVEEGSFTFQQDGSEILATSFDISGGEISFSFSNLSTSEITIVYDGSGDDLKDENDNQLEDTSINASDTSLPEGYYWTSLVFGNKNEEPHSSGYGREFKTKFEVTSPGDYGMYFRYDSSAYNDETIVKITRANGTVEQTTLTEGTSAGNIEALADNNGFTVINFSEVGNSIQLSNFTDDNGDSIAYNSTNNQFTQYTYNAKFHNLTSGTYTIHVSTDENNTGSDPDEIEAILVKIISASSETFIDFQKCIL